MNKVGFMVLSLCLALISGCAETIEGASAPSQPDSGQTVDTASVPSADTGVSPVDSGTSDTGSVDTAVPTDTVDATPVDTSSTTDATDAVLIISPNATRPPSNIVVAGGGVWHVMDDYTGIARGEGASVDRMRLAVRGNSRSFQEIAVAVNGSVIGASVLPAGDGQSIDIDLSSSPLVFPRDMPLRFQTWAEVAPVIPYSDDATPGGHSGDETALGLMASYARGSWEPSYVGNWNVHATGLTSGDTIYAPSAATLFGGNSMVVRRSRPELIALPLSSTTLANGTAGDLYRLQVGADVAGSIAMKKYTFFLEFTRVPGSTFGLEQFRVMRDGVYMTSISIIADGDVDVYHGAIDSRVANVAVSVTFPQEEIISGPGHIYTLQAMPSGEILPGDALRVSLVQASDIEWLTGFLADSPTPLPVWPGVGLAPIFDGGVRQPFRAEGFLWSDLSETRHSDGCCGTPSTRDWTNDSFLHDLTVVRTLSR